MARLHQDENFGTRICFPGLAVLGPEMGPDRPNFKSDSHITALQPVGTVPGSFRPKFGLPAKKATAKQKAITVS